ncbi:MAG: CoA transferase [Chitinispirillaceae bacterium]|nr:CoA transferase [Chitinispirillaceae bacterium]
MTPTLTPTDLLSGIRIVEIGHSDTIHVAGMLLADQGAEVLRIDADRSATSGTAFYKITNRAKQSFLFDADSSEHIAALHQLLGRADVLLEDLDWELELLYHLPAGSLSSTIRCTVVPSDDPGFSGHWTEETVSALAGLYEDGLSVGVPPRFYDLPIATTLGALYTVNAIARELVGRQRFGTIDTVRIPLDHICIFAQSLTIMMRSKPPTRWEPFRLVASPFMGIWKTEGNGYIYFHVGMPRHLRSFLFFLEKTGYGKEKTAIKKYLHPQTRRDPMTAQSVREAMGISRTLQQLFLQKSADEWEKLLGNAGFCCTKIRTFEEWRIHPQVTQTNQILSCPCRDGTDLQVPGPLFDSYRLPSVTVAAERSSVLTADQCLKAWTERPTAPSRSTQSKNRLPLEGIRVLDLGRVIAGPYTGRLLAEAGAEVLHLSLRDNHLQWEEPFGIIYNSGKKSVAVDFTRPEGKEAFNKIITGFKPDIIIHNFMDEAAKKIGCDYATCRKLNKKIICIDFRGYARGGPWSDHPGFEQNIQAASGILSTFCGTTVPRMLPVPMNDLCAGLIGSFGALLTLLNREQKKRGDRITTSIASSSILVHLYFLNKEGVAERRKRINRFYRASDGWLFLSADHVKLQHLKSIPLFQQSNLQDEAFDESLLALIFRKRPVRWWIAKIRSIGAQADIIILPRRTLSTVLKKELSRNDSLFSYRFHEGFGSVVCSRSALTTLKGKVKELVTAPYPGGNNKELLQKFGVDPVLHTVAIPTVNKHLSPLRQQIRRIVWILRQCKWLAVIAYRNRGLLARGTTHT